MYHMLPHSYRPQANFTRTQHGDFQNLIEGFVNKILGETEIVDAESINGRKLFNSIDAFFSYGLLTADGAYWKCIKNFLPKAEQRMLIAECGNANNRFLSIGWLKTSFNKGTLHFMLISLKNESNKVFLNQHYHINACIRNAGLLEAVTEYIEKLQPIQFAFYSTRQMRIEPVPAAVIDTDSVQLSSRDAARQRKLTEKEASSDTVPNIIPTEIPTILSQAIDQNVLLEDLIRNRHNRLNTEMYDSQKPNDEDAPQTLLVVEDTEEKLEDVMTKKMSCANMESMDPDGIEQILASVDHEDDVFPTYNLADGEYQMSQGDTLHFAINVFEKSSEKIIETFKVLEGFHSDDIKLRYFVMTNYNLYVFKYRLHSKNALPGKSTNISSEGFFIPMVKMPHDRIRTIKISVDNLSFMVEANEEGFTHFVQNDELDDQTCFSYYAAMAGLECGAHMVNALINVVEHSSRSLSIHPEVDDHIGYMCMLQPNLEKQLGSNIDIRGAALCFWMEQSSNERSQNMISMSGYLFKTNVSSWIKSSEEPEHKFCMIVSSKLHVFEDFNCRKEDMSFDLNVSSFFSSGRNKFQLKSPDGNYEFECGTIEECTEWTKTLSRLIENDEAKPYKTPCLAVFTNDSIALVQEGEKFWSDGFLRLLCVSKKENLKHAVVVMPPDDKEHYFSNRSPALCLISNDNTVHYFFIRFAKELNRLASVVHNMYGVTLEKFNEKIIQEPLAKTIHNTCCETKDLWPV